MVQELVGYGGQRQGGDGQVQASHVFEGRKRRQTRNTCAAAIRKSIEVTLSSKRFLDSRNFTAFSRSSPRGRSLSSLYLLNFVCTRYSHQYGVICLTGPAYRKPWRNGCVVVSRGRAVMCFRELHLPANLRDQTVVGLYRHTSCPVFSLVFLGIRKNRSGRSTSPEMLAHRNAANLEALFRGRGR